MSAGSAFANQDNLVVLFTPPSDSATDQEPLPGYCLICNVAVPSALGLQQHIEGRSHTNKVASKGLPAHTAHKPGVFIEDLLPRIQAALPENTKKRKSISSEDGAAANPPPAKKHKTSVLPEATCPFCNAKISSITSLLAHLKGPKHIKKLRSSKTPEGLLDLLPLAEMAVDRDPQTGQRAMDELLAQMKKYDLQKPQEKAPPAPAKTEPLPDMTKLQVSGAPSGTLSSSNPASQQSKQPTIGAVSPLFVTHTLSPPFPHQASSAPPVPSFQQIKSSSFVSAPSSSVKHPQQQQSPQPPQQTQDIEFDDSKLYLMLESEIFHECQNSIAPTAAELARRAVAMQILAEKFELQKLDPHSITKSFMNPQLLIVGAHALGLAVCSDPSPPQLLILLDEEISTANENTFFMELEMYLGTGNVHRIPDVAGGEIVVTPGPSQPPVTVRLMFGWRNASIMDTSRSFNPIQHLHFVNWCFSNVFNLAPSLVEVARILRFLRTRKFPPISKCDDLSIVMLAFAAFKSLLSELEPSMISSARLFVAVLRQIASGALLPTFFNGSLLRGHSFYQLGLRMTLQDRLDATSRAVQLLSRIEDQTGFVKSIKDHMGSTIM